MAFIPAENVIEAALQYQCEGSNMRNILNFRFPGIGTPASMDGLMLELQDWYVDHLRGVTASNIQFTGIKLSDLTTADGRVMQWQPPTTEWGASPSPAAAANVSLAVKFSSGHRGRNANGRMFFVGLPQSAVSGSYVSTVHRDNILAKMLLLLTPEVIFAHKLCVVSRWYHSERRQTAMTYDVIDITADTGVDSQRRRLPGRGE